MKQPDENDRDADLRELFRRTSTEFGGVDARGILERAERSRRARSTRTLRAAAAVLLLGIGAIGGWAATHGPALERELDARVHAALERELDARVHAALERELDALERRVEERVEKLLVAYAHASEESLRRIQQESLKEIANLLRRDYETRIERLKRAIGRERGLALAPVPESSTSED